MVDFNTNLHLPLNIGSDSNPSLTRSIEKISTTPPKNIESGLSQQITGNFSDAFYGDGPYSLEHPNNTTELVAQYVDYLA